MEYKGSILYANTIDYNFGLQQRPMHLMRLLAERGWKVYFINPEDNKKKNRRVRERIGNLEIYNSWEVFKKRVKDIDVYFSSWAKRHVELNEINTKMVVYDSVDNFEEWEKDEPIMISKSDIVFTTSHPLYKIRSKQHNNVIMCRNGCFSELGNQKYKIPEDLQRIKMTSKKPILLFSGAIASWVDTSLMSKLALTYCVVIVGRPFGASIPKNCIYLGLKKYDELQAYYAHCDIGLLPFLKSNQAAYYSNPIKCYEYAAHGKQVVAYDIPEATLYNNVVVTARKEKEFIQKINFALKRKDDQNIIDKCKQMARENDWNDRVDIIENAIISYLEKLPVRNECL